LPQRQHAHHAPDALDTAQPLDPAAGGRQPVQQFFQQFFEQLAQQFPEQQPE